MIKWIIILQIDPLPFISYRWLTPLLNCSHQTLIKRVTGDASVYASIEAPLSESNSNDLNLIRIASDLNIPNRSKGTFVIKQVRGESDVIHDRILVESKSNESIPANPELDRVKESSPSIVDCRSKSNEGAIDLIGMTRDHFHHSLGWEVVSEIYKTISLLILLAQFPLSAVTAELEMSLGLMTLQSLLLALYRPLGPFSKGC